MGNPKEEAARVEFDKMWDFVHTVENTPLVNGKFMDEIYSEAELFSTSTDISMLSVQQELHLFIPTIRKKPLAARSNSPNVLG